MMANLLLVTRGSYGDLVPFVALGEALTGRGHRVTIVSHCHYESAVRAAGLEFATWDTPSSFQSFIADGPLLDSPSTVAEFARRHVLPQVAAEFRVLSDRVDRPNTVIVARHMGSLAAAFVAESFKVPLVATFIAVAQANCWALFRWLYEVELRRDLMSCRKRLGLPAVAGPDHRRPAMYCGSWPEWFARPQPTWPGAVRTMGFVKSDAIESGPLPSHVETWLDGGPRPVLITGGTARWALTPRFYEAAIAGCRAAGYRALVACPHADCLPSDRDADVMSHARLPFASVAPRAAGIVHHGGTSVLVRGLAADLPQLSMPYGADRPDTARRLADSGAATMLLPHDWQPSRVAQTLRDLLTSPQVRSRCQDLGRRIRDDQRELEESCDAIEMLTH